MKIHTINIDLGKTSFHLVGLNESGKVMVRNCSREKRVLRFTANRNSNGRGGWKPPRMLSLTQSIREG